MTTTLGLLRFIPVALLLTLVFSVGADEPAKRGSEAGAIARWIERLSSERFEEREEATRGLEIIGAAALPALRRAVTDGTDLETRRRAEMLARRIGAVANAVALLEKLANTITVDPKQPGRPVVAVTLRSSAIKNEHIRQLAVLTHLEVVRVQNASITADSLTYLAGLSRLRVLELSHCLSLSSYEQPLQSGARLIRAPFLGPLTALTRLEALDLSGTTVSNQDLPDLVKLPRLRHLNLNHTAVTGAALDQVARLTNLESLGLAYTGTHDADLKKLAALKALADLDLDNTHVSDAGLRELARLPALRGLNLAHCQHVTDAGLACLQPLKQLRTLHLDYTRVTNAGLKHLQGLRSLEALTLDATRVDDAGVAHLRNLTALRTLRFGHGIGDRGVAQLKRHTRLQTLTGLTHITDAGLADLLALHDLQVLDVEGARITDAGLARLQALTQLRELNLRGTPITDDGLRHLEGLRYLERLDLFGTKVTAAGRGRLQKALPGLTLVARAGLIDQIRNSKLEIRNKFEIPNSKQDCLGF